MIEIVSLETATLGDRSYLAHDGSVAAVIDPQRDIDRMQRLAADLGVRVTHVFETHLHNDYVTGGLALAAEAGAEYHVNAADAVAFDRVPVKDGLEIAVGDMTVRALATPGHTHTHLSYVLHAEGSDTAVFTGGSLLYGSTGRPDLLGPEHTGTLARAQYASAHRLADVLPESTVIYPTHGFGSFCSATQSRATSSTIGREKLANPVLTETEERYVAELLAGLDAYPAYYARMAPANAAGPQAPDLSAPRRADAREIRRRIADGEWVVDLRTRKAFAAGHVAGTLNIGLDGQLATYLGWLIPWGTPLTLLAETPAELAAAQRELVRIGIDRPAAANVGTPEEWSDGSPLRAYPTATFADLAAVLHHRHVHVLDVRRDLEWTASHLPGALHIPLAELADRLDELPDGEVWVHCAAGYRAAIAASLLDAVGRPVVAVDDDFSNAAASGLV
ncbi:glyoxylase-like metal-dependent hydrolase (beta-lactamase superfamily II) [Actinocorallia herbida]|uniref:Glyoxylase-like metal-dependent hydrolase (Beta-lactamase superfamily II) n=1 Tax=Actinocorallia herbida TaxID=58109 RepID=A0A3N1CZZ5_9ACTN|nr:MBL fold metallo-hydrolase [Actinocorallia herbida]ROO86832.1 glyoxylase-like metal-dependent hydrolase (beta-lactamase superfamily II) [Actinocorallia herbida]